MIIGTAGHIDHGKTALVQALTGVDTDRLPEERRRGISIELGFAPLVIDGVGTVGVVDVPGHEAFVRTMVAGATGVDVALLTVAADEGVMPQTREHLAILELLGVQSLVVAITKADLVDDELIVLVREDVLAHLAGTRMGNPAVVVTSVRNGRGIEELKHTLAWHLRNVSPRSDDDLFRLHVDRCFTLRGTGTVVTGTVGSGRIREGDNVRIHPLDRVVRVRGLQRHGESVDTAGPGERTALALASVEVAEIPRGSQLVSPVPWHSSRVVHVHVVRSRGLREWRPRERLRLHVGTSEVGARVVKPAESAFDRDGPARLVIDHDVLLRAGDHFVLRQPSSELGTVGGGVVTDPTPFKRRSRPVILAGWTPQERLTTILTEASAHGVDSVSLPIRLGVTPSQVRELARSSAQAVTAGGRIYLKQVLEDATQRVVADVVTFHASNPLEAGISLSYLRSQLNDETFAAAVVEQLERSGRLVVRDGVIRLSDWRPQVAGKDAKDRDAVLKRLKAAGREPPSVSELRQEIGGRDPLPLLKVAEHEGLVIQVELDRYYDTDAVAGMMQEMREQMRKGEVYAPTQLREILGVSRKYLMPFLEYCDRKRFTERLEQGRVLGAG